MGNRSKSSLVHGHTIGHKRSRTHLSWTNMLTRTTNQNNIQYPDYGGRGIDVCERWLVFTNFLADMGECPEGFTLERRDNDRGYYPENCYWATPKQQANNRRTNHRLSFQGLTLTIAEWADRTGIRSATITARINSLNWPVERALTEGATCQLQIGIVQSVNV